MCYTYHMVATSWALLALISSDRIVIGIAGFDLLALPIVIAFLVVRGRRKGRNR
jgi:hypothetical protein